METISNLLNWRRRESGFSLVELMIGLAIGLIVALAVLQSLSLFDSQKSGTVSVSEAQENGLVSLAMLEQDIHNAGASLADKTVYGCTNFYTWYDDGSGAPGPIPNFDIMPVRITDGGTGPDSITVQYGTNFTGTLPATLNVNASAPEDPYVAGRIFDFAAGDMVLAVSGTECTLVRVTGTDATLSNIQHAATTGTNYNPSPAPVSWPLYGVSGATRLFNLGRYVTDTYALSGNNLVAGHRILGPLPWDNNLASPTAIASNVVEFQAQYGIAKASPANYTEATTVTQWVNATPPWDAPSAADIQRIIAIRLALVTRGTKMESSAMSSCTSDSGVANKGPCAWKADTTASPAPMIDLSAQANWDKYRYRVYQTIIPLRNVIWTFSQ